MISGATRRGLPNLPGVPHLHVNKPLEEVTEKEQRKAGPNFRCPF